MRSNNPNWRNSPGAKAPVGQQNVQIDLEMLKRKACKNDECGCTDFFPKFSFFDIPIVLRPQPAIDQLQVQNWVCMKCGAVQMNIDMILLPSLRDLENGAKEASVIAAATGGSEPPPAASEATAP